ncbi:MAG TPA: acetamidase/formamidase family protein [Gemmatimonadaceae bacterium]|jgi:acetamidase/formamidase
MRIAILTSVALVALGCHSVVTSGIASSPQFAVAPPGSHHYTLDPSPTTVAWGHYWSEAKPVLRIHSGDEVTVGTLLTSSPDRLAQNGVDSAAIEQSLRDVYREVPRESRGPGGHILTGPIYVEEADSGDVLQVDIERVDLAIPYAYNGFGPNRGWLPEDFTHAKTKIIPLDRERMVAHFAPNIAVPLHPFFGSMGVAPPPAMGRINSAPPGIHAGNLDNKELVAGTTLYIPVHVKGALLEIGDGHAGQGNGEVDITALETSLRGRLRVTVRKDMHLVWPRGETPTHWIAMGIDSSLVNATKTAVREAINFLVTEKHLSRDDAYMLISVSSDVDITQLVDGTLGVHVMIPKAPFKAGSQD